MTGNDIYRAIEFLKAGELVAIPTETVYGLAANAFNANAVAKIYEVKNRPFFNPLIIHTDSVEKMKEWGLTIPEKMSQLINEFSPGPITYVIPTSSQIPDLVTAGTNAVAIRIPNHPLTLSLLAQIDFPLAAPSANPSGFISPTNAWHVNEQLGDKIAYILNGGECSVGIESTIISFVHEEPTLLRLGGISKEEIEKCIGSITDGTQYTLSKDGEDEAPLAPGMLSRHYAPSHQLIFGNVKKYIPYFEPERIGVIAFSSIYENIPARNQFVLSMNRDLKEAAQKLFSAMREADKMDVDVILAEKFPDEGIGRAINDRLKRASLKE
jgi:L-threonylcarbamoyladenylate synthase